MEKKRALLFLGPRVGIKFRRAMLAEIRFPPDVWQDFLQKKASNSNLAEMGLKWMACVLQESQLV